MSTVISINGHQGVQIARLENLLDCWSEDYINAKQCWFVRWRLLMLHFSAAVDFLEPTRVLTGDEGIINAL